MTETVVHDLTPWETRVRGGTGATSPLKSTDDSAMWSVRLCGGDILVTAQRKRCSSHLYAGTGYTGTVLAV